MKGVKEERWEGVRAEEGLATWKCGEKSARRGSMKKEKVRRWNDWKEIERDKINFILNCRTFNL